MARHKSDSTEQIDAERYILGEIAKRESLNFDDYADLGIVASPDGINQQKKVMVEVYAHIGRLKGAQLHKVKADILKLAYIERKLGGNWKKIICYGCREAAFYLKGKSWAAEVAKALDIKVMVVPLSDEQKQNVLESQNLQRMMNAQ